LTATAQSLEIIAAGLERLGRMPTLRLLRPGLPASQVNAALEQWQLRATPDMEEAYAWHDGTDATTGEVLNDLWLFPGYYFLSLDDAMANYRAFRDDPRWDPSWVPVFADGGGDFLAVQCDARSDGWGAVIDFSLEDVEQSIQYASLSALFATVAAAFDADLFYVDDTGRFEMNDPAFIDLAREMNGELDYWQQ
jgi:cell wall assembly regulator SMI1